MDLEPVGKNTEYEKEDCESKKHETTHYANCIPDLSRIWGDKVIVRKTKVRLERGFGRLGNRNDAHDLCLLS